MTYVLPNTPHGANKAARFYTPSPFSSQFSHLIRTLAIASEAERNIEDADPAHAKFDSWMAEAEHAWDSVTNSHLVLTTMPVTRPRDRPLQMLASLINLRRGVMTTAELREVHQLVQERASRLVCPGHRITARRIRSMLDHGRALLEAVDGFELFQPIDVPEDCPEGNFEA